MPSQYALPRQDGPVTAGSPAVSPSSRAAHALLDIPVSEFAQKNFPQYASMIPADKAKLTVREALKGANFLEKQLFMSKLATVLPKGVTTADIDKAVNEPPPPPEKPAPAPAPAPVPAPAPAAPAPAKQYALPPTAPAPPPAAPAPPAPAPAPVPATAPAGPVAPAPAAPAAPVTGGPLDYIAKNGGHASVLDKNGQIVPVHPGTRGNYAPVNPEFAARLAAAGQAYEKATGKAPQYGELARGNDVQQIYYDRYKSGQGGIAAPPGASQHQKGAAGDLPSGGFRDWLYAGNADKYGLHFPVRGDVPHVQMNPDFKGNLATASAAPASGDPRFPANTGPPKVGPEGVPIPPQAETANAAVPAGLDSGRMRQAFLNTILKGEAPKGSYGLVNGGGQITDFSKAPTGTAASGQYQFLPSTWAEQAKKYGYTDFKPETQDTAAWNYAKDIYKQKAGRDLGADLMSKDPQVLNGIGTALNKTWTSLPGGPEPNSNWKGQDFASAYSSNLGDGDIGGGGATPDAGTATASATPDASGASSSSGFNMKDFGSNLGSGLGDIGSIMAKGPVAQNAATKSGPANLPMTTLPPPVGPVPMVDPRVADAQRQQLAVALQRLNSRRLV